MEEKYTQAVPGEWDCGNYGNISLPKMFTGVYVDEGQVHANASTRGPIMYSCEKNISATETVVRNIYVDLHGELRFLPLC